MIPALLVLVPLVAGIVAIALFKEAEKLKYIAMGASALGFILALLANYGNVVYQWFTIGSYAINISVLVSPLNFMLLLLVTFIGTVVIVYSAGYMGRPSEQRRFYIELLAFEAAMATFAISGNFITFFIAWEFLSLTSYLLIGFWYEKDNANAAARKALTIIFIGDLALLGSIILFWNAFGTLEFAQILTAAGTNSSPSFMLAVFLLLIAVFTKSAQFPFQEWLTDAMEGPTPVSAYLHSSTMVKAGVFATILLFPIFKAAGVLPVILIFGIVTTIIATFGALRETQIKKIIAYSTIQELSIMFIAVGSGAILAAIYFFFAQTFYKALLFFGAGNIMEATKTDQITTASGLKSNKLIYYTTLSGVLSLAGFVPFSGFFANSGISTSLYSNLPVYAIISAISLLTSFYILRWLLYPSKKPTNLEVSSRYNTQPKEMTYTMALLALLTLAASAFFFYMSNFLSYGGYLPFISGMTLGVNTTDAAIFLVAIVIGAILSYLTYGRNMIKVSAKKLDPLIYTRPIINFFYRLVAAFIFEISDAVNTLDLYLSDVFDRVGRLTMDTGIFIRKASVGDINMYALIVVVGIIVMFGAFYILVIS